VRLYPAAIAAVLVTACVIGPLVTTLPVASYFTHPMFFQYLQTGSLIRIYFQLPGVFTHSPLGTDVNTSLWSLSLEWKCYAGLFLLSFINRNFRWKLVYGLILLLFIAHFFDSQLESLGKQMIHPAFNLAPYLQLVVFFLIGTLCYHHRENLKIHPWWIPAIAVLAFLSAWFGVLQTALFVLLPASVLCWAVSGNRLIHRLTPKPDLSYGLYVWGFPVEQLTANYLHPTSPGHLFVLVILLTTPLACLSWYFIESPTLKTKKAVR
jgi:peptidoglycan/LPS O-acetylase OafA/YrhL